MVLLMSRTLFIALKRIDLKPLQNYTAENSNRILFY